MYADAIITLNFPLELEVCSGAAEAVSGSYRVGEQPLSDPSLLICVMIREEVISRSC